MKLKILFLLIGVVLLETAGFTQSFTKVTNGDIVNNGGSSLGGAWGDYDNDGDPDLFVPNINNENNFLYENNGDGTFTRITTGPLVSDQGMSISASWGDYDNDGFLDLVVTNAGQDNFLYNNNGDGTFTKITDGPIITNGSGGCAWGDYNSDGWLDLIIVSSGPNSLFENNGDGTFTLITTGEVATDGGNSVNANWVDYNNDNNLDLFVVNDSEVNFLYEGNGQGGFSKNATGEIATDVEASFSSSWGDVDHDGRLDLIVANRAGQANSFYANLDGTNFQKQTRGDLGLDLSASEGSAFADFDNDGWLDLFVANSNSETNLLYQNNKDGTFTSLVGNTVTIDPVSNVGTAWADYDLDGDMDLFVSTVGGNNLLFRNNTSGNNYLRLKLTGLIQNKFAVGTSVEVFAVIDGVSEVVKRVVNTSSGNRGQTPNTLHFGLGDASIIDDINIRWPNGTFTSLTNIAVNQELEISGLGPDLQITFNSLDFSIIKAGSRNSLTTQIRNFGDFTSSFTSVSYYLSDDNSLDGADVLLGSHDVLSLGQNTSTFFAVAPTIPASTSPGSYFILTVVDALENVEETDEGNNIDIQSLEVVDFDLPDFTVQQGFKGLFHVNPGQDITSPFDRVNNNGSADATNVEIQYVLSTDIIIDGGDVVLTTVSEDIDANSSVVLETPLTIPPGTPEGVYNILIVADRDNLIQELDETNNVDPDTDKFQPEVVLFPPHPTNLTAELMNDDHILLNWIDNTSEVGSGFEENEYVVVRNGVDYANLPADSDNFSDFGITAGVFYDYQVYAYRNDVVPINDVNGNVTSIVSNPVPGGINSSSFVGRVDKSTDGLSGLYFDLPFPLNLDLNAQFYLKVYSPVVGATVKFKIENSDDSGDFVERDVATTTSGAWEELLFDFSGEANETYDIITLYFDFGSTTANTFYFDDLSLSNQTIDLESGTFLVRIESERSNIASSFLPDPNCTFDIPTGVTWTGTAQNDPFGCLDPGTNNPNIIITDLGDGTFRISDLMARAYFSCGFDEDEPAIFGNPCTSTSVISDGASWQFAADGLMTYDEMSQTLTIPYRDVNNNVSHVTVLTANSTGILPSIPGNLTAEGISASQISLEWDASFNADTYTIERSTTSGTGFSFLVTISSAATKFVDSNGLSEGTEYFYRISAGNAEGDSQFGNEASAIPIVASFEKIVSGELIESTSGQGSAWGDYDNDGDLDLFTPTFSGLPNFFFENNGDGTFTRITNISLVEDTIITRTGSWADINNDGHLDLFTANADTAGFIFMNNGDKTFTKSAFGDDEDENLQTAAWADYNTDGFIDLFVARRGLLNNTLYMGNGDGTFVAVDEATFPSDNGAESWGAGWSDYDLDGDPDLFVANRNGQQDLLYQNNGDGTFSLVDNLLTTNLADSRSPSWGDFDNDGDEDLFVGTPSGAPNLLYENNGDGTFSKITSGIVVDNALRGYGSSWADFDNDGWLDLFLATTSNNQVYINNGDKTFSALVGEPLVDNTDFTIGGSSADFNGDGFIDLVVPNTNEVSNDLYLNNGNSGNGFINIFLVGTETNTAAIGTRVVVTAGGMNQYQTVSGQTGYGSQNSLNVEFGLGTATNIDEIRIEWPSGFNQVLTDVAPNQFITIFEDTSGPDITLVNLLDVFSDDDGGKIEADVTDVSGVASVQLHFRGTASDPMTFDMTDMVAGSQADRYELDLNISDFDELGLTAFVLATDQLGNESSSDTVSIYLDFTDTDATLVGLTSGTDVSSYQMFSIPVDLDQRGVAAVFSELGAYDKSQWRVFHYQNGTNVEFQSGLTNIERGKGYWLIAKSVNSSIQAGSGDNALQNDMPFSISLSQGWNQIGNPYAFNISWQDVLDYNGLTNEVSGLFTFAGGSYTNPTRLESYEGAFVEAQSNITIQIPVLKNQSVQGGRIANNGRVEKEQFDPKNWELNLEVLSGKITNSLGGVGMHESAKIERDVFDIPSLPRFIKYSDIRFDHPEDYMESFVKDIVPSTDNHIWEFTVSSNFDVEKIGLNWDQIYLSTTDKKFILFDIEAQKVVDMSYQNTYNFPKTLARKFKLLYGNENFINENLVTDNSGFGNVYPNPFRSAIEIPFHLKQSTENYTVDILVYDTKGNKVIGLMEGQRLDAGFHMISWDGFGQSNKKVDAGMYMVRLIVNGTTGREEYYTRIIKK